MGRKRRQKERMMEIPFYKVTVREAVALMEGHGGYVDGDKEAVVLNIEEEEER